jgi:hypothetical protein
MMEIAGRGYNRNFNTSNLKPNEKLPLILQFRLIAGPFMTMIDTSVVNIALPEMGD